MKLRIRLLKKMEILQQKKPPGIIIKKSAGEILTLKTLTRKMHNLRELSEEEKNKMEN